MNSTNDKAIKQCGSLIGVDGRLQTRNYENQQGQRVYITEVLAESFAFLEPRANAKPHQTPPKS